MNSFEITITSGKTVFKPVVVGSVSLYHKKNTAPKRLLFNVLNDGKISFLEGALVTLTVDGKNMFFGYVFSKERDRENIIKVTCYDQLRYFKNKAFYDYYEKTASQLILTVAKDFNLKTGEIADTKLKLSALKDGAALFDIVLEALSLTLESTGREYILFDDFGKICLKDSEEMKTGFWLKADNSMNFSYETSIDKETYNKIMLVQNNRKTSFRKIFSQKDDESIKSLGVLQYFENIGEDILNGEEKAKNLLKRLDKKSRTLTVYSAAGDLSVLAGSYIFVSLNLGDIIVNGLGQVLEVTHVFENGSHFMDLVVGGGIFEGV